MQSYVLLFVLAWTNRILQALSSMPTPWNVAQGYAEMPRPSKAFASFLLSLQLQNPSASLRNTPAHTAFFQPRIASKVRRHQSHRMGAFEGYMDPGDVVLPEGALVVVAGAGTPLGRLVVDAIPSAGSGWTVRELDMASPAQSLSGADAVVVISESAGGKGGVEPDKVKALVESIGASMRRLVMASSHGVESTNKFSFGNMFGQLDKQRDAEEDVALQAMLRRPRDDDGKEIPVPCFSIVRMGSLQDDSDKVTSKDIILAPKSRDVLEPGDNLEGEVLLSTAAAIIIQTLKQQDAVDAKFSLGRSKTPFAEVSEDQLYWDDQFAKMSGPEIFRQPLTKTSAETMAKNLREWAVKYTKKGSGLTSPVEVSDVENGVLIQFVTRENKKPDGALLFVAEESPSPRVRAVRTLMKERDDIIIKPMSEEQLLSDLKAII